ncbi:MAG: hypothetical protein AB7P17_00120 [Nitrospirales bacterium]|nr:hypothetical protein [Nitrospirales bacterium]
MRTINKRLRVHVLTLAGLLFLISTGGALAPTHAFVRAFTFNDQQKPGIQTHERDEKEEAGDTPIIPPTNDPEMVIQPDVPPDPDAVITPPVVDPEMAVDPTTRQRMTEEELEQLSPEELGKRTPEKAPNN